MNMSGRVPMNAVLEEIMATRTVTNGLQTFPVRAHVDRTEAGLIRRAVMATRPKVSLEVGFAYGISALFICDTLAELGSRSRHIVLDPNQSTNWRGIGLRNLQRAGYGDVIELREERSEFALPQLLKEGVVLDFAFIDGWHTFDHVLLDFFYINRMLRVGGIVAFDDVDFPAIDRVVKHVSTYPCYTLFGTNLDESEAPTNGPNGQSRRRPNWRDPAFYRHARDRILVKRKWDRALLQRAWRRALSSAMPTCVAFRKIAEDQRSWDWHRPF
jgi:predicted O-methyltransferase YrrM